jgi:hypothetical protein
VPKVIKQSVPPVNRIAVANGHPGSILSGAIDVADIIESWLRAVIYGVNRCGKTTLACQFEKPLLLVAFEPNPTGGANSVKKIPGVKFLRISNDINPSTGKVVKWASQKGLELCKELSQGCPFATVVVDGATSYQELVLQEVMKWDQIPEQLSFGMVGKERYQARAEQVKEGLRPFFNLPCHVILLAKEKDHNPPKDDYSSINKLTGGFQLGSFFAEDVGGSVAGWLHDACDYITRLSVEMETREQVVPAIILNDKEVAPASVTRVETGRKVRRLRLCYEPNTGRVGFAAGMRSSNPDSVPEWIEARSPEEMHAKLMAVIDGTYVVN